MILLQEASTHNEEVTLKAKEQFHLYYGADQLILFHVEFDLQQYSNEEVRCLPQGRVPERLAHTANGQSHVSDFLMLRALPRTFRTAWC